jgi:hypothetical protein
MFYNPIEEGVLKANVVPSFFAFDPFMPQDLLALS